jgi:formiminoglutamase
MDFIKLLTPTNLVEIFEADALCEGDLGNFVHFSETGGLAKGTQLAIIGVPDGRSSGPNHGCQQAPREVRKYLYRLKKAFPKCKITDLGDLIPGNSVADTHVAIGMLVEELVKKEVVPIIIGGAHHLAYGQYLGYEKLDEQISMTSIDNNFDLDQISQGVNSKSHFYHAFVHPSFHLFHFSNIGFQSYFVDDESVRVMEKLEFDAFRLGEAQKDIFEMEPVIRNANIVSMDISAVRQSGAPGNANSSPNGFYGEQFCQLARYAGISDAVSSFGVYEINPEFDNRGQTVHLGAQAIWCFIEGFYSRVKENPISNADNFYKYRTIFKNNDQEIVFYKSKTTERWWMKVPHPGTNDINAPYHLIPCSYSDYEKANEEEIPDRWLKAFNKL